MKKFVSYALCLAMLCSAAGLPAAAEEADTGTAEITDTPSPEAEEIPAPEMMDEKPLVTEAAPVLPSEEAQEPDPETNMPVELFETVEQSDTGEDRSYGFGESYIAVSYTHLDVYKRQRI